MRVGLFSWGPSDRARRNSLRLLQRRSRLDIRKNVFIKKMVKHWNKLPTEVMESSLGAFKKHVNVMLTDGV